MSWCEIFAVFFGGWAAWVTYLYFKADTLYWDQKGWVTRTENEIAYIRNRYPELWKEVASRLEMRYLDEGYTDNV